MIYVIFAQYDKNNLLLNFFAYIYIHCHVSSSNAQYCVCVLCLESYKAAILLRPLEDKI